MVSGEIVKKQRLVNIHAHLRKGDDVDKAVNAWREDGAIKVCILALGKQLSQEHFTNEMVLEVMKKHPDLIVGMGHIELAIPMDPVEKIEKLKEEGFLGLKFFSPCAYYGDEIYSPYYEKAQELEMPIIFHIGLVVRAKGDREFQVNSEWMRPYTFDRIARCFPELKIIGAHFGHPHQQEAFAVSSAFSNVYCSPAGGAGSDFHISKLKKALAPFPGADWDNPDKNVAKTYFKKFVFGIDNPPISIWYPQAVKLMDYLHIDEETRELFFWKNAYKIFNWSF
jgi:predicted TIM-barrel fold metal-dependent hydrolase